MVTTVTRNIKVHEKAAKFYIGVNGATINERTQTTHTTIITGREVEDSMLNVEIIGMCNEDIDQAIKRMAEYTKYLKECHFYTKGRCRKSSTECKHAHSAPPYLQE